MLVKPKCVWEVADFLKNCKQTAEKCKQIFENWKNLPPLKHILSLPTLGQICTITELHPFEISTFQKKHPVLNLVNMTDNFSTQWEWGGNKISYISEFISYLNIKNMANLEKEMKRAIVYVHGYI